MNTSSSPEVVYETPEEYRNPEPPPPTPKCPECEKHDKVVLDLHRKAFFGWRCTRCKHCWNVCRNCDHETTGDLPPIKCPKCKKKRWPERAVLKPKPKADLKNPIGEALRRGEKL